MTSLLRQRGEVILLIGDFHFFLIAALRLILDRALKHGAARVPEPTEPKLRTDEEQQR